jgi:hypothetical protein
MVLKRFIVMFLLVVWIGLFVGLNEITRTVTSYVYGKI